MRFSDVSLDGTWTIPTEHREKGNAGELVLPELALDTSSANPASPPLRYLHRLRRRASPQLL